MTETVSSPVGPTTRWVGILALLLVAFGVAYFWNAPTYQPAEPDPGVLLLRYNERSKSTELREQGFLDTMEKEFPEVRILSSDQYLGSTRSSAVRRSRQLIERYGDAITGIFCVNESSTVGCLEALQELNRAGSVPFMGFDVTPAMIAALKRGEMAGFVVQDPKNIGYEAVNAARSYLRNESVNNVVYTGHSLVGSENVESEGLRPLVYPDRFSGERFTPDEAEFTLGFVPRGIIHDYWQSVRAGVEEAAREAGDTLIQYESPAVEDDVEGQIEIVRKMIAAEVDAICLAPVDSSALQEVVLEAKAAGVPVILFDSGLDIREASETADAVVCYVATDNYDAGAVAARCLAAAIKAGGFAN